MDASITVNAGEKVGRLAVSKCGTATRFDPANMRVSILRLSFVCRLPSFEATL